MPKNKSNHNTNPQNDEPFIKEIPVKNKKKKRNEIKNLNIHFTIDTEQSQEKIFVLIENTSKEMVKEVDNLQVGTSDLNVNSSKKVDKSIKNSQQDTINSSETTTKVVDKNKENSQEEISDSNVTNSNNETKEIKISQKEICYSNETTSKNEVREIKNSQEEICYSNETTSKNEVREIKNSQEETSDSNVTNSNNETKEIRISQEEICNSNEMASKNISIETTILQEETSRSNEMTSNIVAKEIKNYQKEKSDFSKNASKEVIDVENLQVEMHEKKSGLKETPSNDVLLKNNNSQEKKLDLSANNCKNMINKVENQETSDVTHKAFTRNSQEDVSDCKDNDYIETRCTFSNSEECYRNLNEKADDKGSQFKKPLKVTSDLKEKAIKDQIKTIEGSYNENSELLDIKKIQEKENGNDIITDSNLTLTKSEQLFKVTIFDSDTSNINRSYLPSITIAIEKIYEKDKNLFKEIDNVLKTISPLKQESKTSLQNAKIEIINTQSETLLISETVKNTETEQNILFTKSVSQKADNSQENMCDNEIGEKVFEDCKENRNNNIPNKFYDSLEDKTSDSQEDASQNEAQKVKKLQSEILDLNEKVNIKNSDELETNSKEDDYSETKIQHEDLEKNGNNITSNTNLTSGNLNQPHGYISFTLSVSPNVNIFLLANIIVEKLAKENKDAIKNLSIELKSFLENNLDLRDEHCTKLQKSTASYLPKICNETVRISCLMQTNEKTPYFQEYESINKEQIPLNLEVKAVNQNLQEESPDYAIKDNIDSIENFTNKVSNQLEKGKDITSDGSRPDKLLTDIQNICKGFLNLNEGTMMSVINEIKNLLQKNYSKKESSEYKDINIKNTQIATSNFIEEGRINTINEIKNSQEQTVSLKENTSVRNAAEINTSQDFIKDVSNITQEEILSLREDNTRKTVEKLSETTPDFKQKARRRLSLEINSLPEEKSFCLEKSCVSNAKNNENLQETLALKDGNNVSTNLDVNFAPDVSEVHKLPEYIQTNSKEIESLNETTHNFIKNGAKLNNTPKETSNLKEYTDERFKPENKISVLEKNDMKNECCKNVAQPINDFQGKTTVFKEDASKNKSMKTKSLQEESSDLEIANNNVLMKIENEKSLRSLEARVSELKEAQEYTDILEKMLRISEARVGELEEMQNMSEARVGELEEMLNLSEARVDELAAMQNMSEARVGELEQMQNMSEARVGELEQMQNMSEARVGELEEMLNLSEARVDKLVAMQNMSEARVGELEQMQNMSEARVGELEEMLNLSETRVAELKIEVDETLRRSPAPQQARRDIYRRSLHDSNRYAR